MLRDEVLALLKAREGKPLSGEEMSRALGVSRAAVWKAMESLRDEGYVISSAPRRGYALEGSPDRLSAGELGRSPGGPPGGPRAGVPGDGGLHQQRGQAPGPGRGRRRPGGGGGAADRRPGPPGPLLCLPCGAGALSVGSPPPPVPSGGGVDPDGVDGGGGVQCGGAGVRRAAGDQVAQRRDPGRAEAVRHSHRAGAGGGDCRPAPCGGGGGDQPHPDRSRLRAGGGPGGRLPGPGSGTGPPPGGDGGGRAGRPGRAVRRLPGRAGGLAGAVPGPTVSPWAGRCACSGRARRRRPLPRRWTMPSPWWCAAPTAAGRRCPPARCPSGGCWGMCDFQKRGTCPALFA